MALLLTACGSAGQPEPYDPTGIDGLEIPTPSPDPADFVGRVDNPWFPLPPGGSRRYAVTEGGRQVGDVRVDVLRRTVVSGVDATAVLTTTRVRKEEPEAVTRYYAQDEAGNVWLLGEDADGTRWRAGEAGAEAGLAMPAEPRVGDGWLRAVVPGTAEQTVRVAEPGDFSSSGDTEETVRTVEVDSRGRRTDNAYQAGLGLVESVDREDGRTTTLVSPPPA